MFWTAREPNWGRNGLAAVGTTQTLRIGATDPAAREVTLDSVNDTEVGSRSLGEIRSRIAAGLVGRERELDLLLEAVACGRDLALEGRRGLEIHAAAGDHRPAGYPTDIR